MEYRRQPIVPELLRPELVCQRGVHRSCPRWLSLLLCGHTTQRVACLLQHVLTSEDSFVDWFSPSSRVWVLGINAPVPRCVQKAPLPPKPSLWSLGVALLIYALKVYSSLFCLFVLLFSREGFSV